MTEKLTLPKFVNEAEEAQWWFDHQDDLFETFQRAEATGELGRGTLANRARASTAAIALDPEDVCRAQLQAEKRGLDYREYVKTVVHQALIREEQSA